MKKSLFLITFLICASISFAQYPNNQFISNNQTRYHIPIAKVDSSLLLPIKDTLNNQSTVYPGAITIRPTDTLNHANPPVYMSNGIYWSAVFGGGSGAIIPGGPITTIPVVGTNPGTNLTSVDWVIATFYGKQPPLATLTGGGTFEFTSSPTFPTTLNWSASRQSNTDPLATITVAGTSQTFVQPAQPGTVSGTQAVTVTTNTNTTYSNVVVATNGQTATANTTFTYQSKYYRGFIPTSTPSDADIIAATGENVGGTFATTFNALGVLTAPASESFIVFAFPASFGTATIKINGLAVGYTLITRSFTNASGYSVSYNIYVSPYSTNGGVDYQIL